MIATKIQPCLDTCHIKLGGLFAGLVVTICAGNAYATESHMALALEHAQTAAKTNDAKTLVNHADAAKSHLNVVDEHLKTGNSSLDAAIEHAKQSHAELAKKSAEAAVEHLQAAQ
jgi:hypothetical protein